jgi:hypothetical protein
MENRWCMQTHKQNWQANRPFSLFMPTRPKTHWQRSYFSSLLNITLPNLVGKNLTGDQRGEAVAYTSIYRYRLRTSNNFPESREIRSKKLLHAQTLRQNIVNGEWNYLTYLSVSPRVSGNSTMKKNNKFMKKHGSPREVNSRSANKLSSALCETRSQSATSQSQFTIAVPSKQWWPMWSDPFRITDQNSLSILISPLHVACSAHPSLGHPLVKRKIIKLLFIQKLLSKYMSDGLRITCKLSRLPLTPSLPN